MLLSHGQGFLTGTDRHFVAAGGEVGDLGPTGRFVESMDVLIETGLMQRRRDRLTRRRPGRGNPRARGSAWLSS